MKRRVVSFYGMVFLDNYYELKKPILKKAQELCIRGTVSLALEGVNGTVTGEYDSVTSFFDFLRKDKRFDSMVYNDSDSDFWTFDKIKIRLKRELVALGDPALRLYEAEKGEYLSPDAWNDLIVSEEVQLIDTRNTYEIECGTFLNAIDPKTENFRDFPAWFEEWSKDKNKESTKVAMFCTGGIRCEKSTAYVKSMGFKNVYHLDGGILRYLSDKKKKDNLWQGECFVFDDRIAVDKDLNPTNTTFTCSICCSVIRREDVSNMSKGKVTCKSCFSLKSCKLHD